MNNFKMEVSKKATVAGKPQYVKQGKVTIYYPLLADFGIAAEVKEIDEEGFPVYSDAKLQYVFDAILAAVKAQARNKLVSGTAMLAAFKAWLATTGKKEAVQAAVYSLAANHTGLSLQSEEKKGKFQVYLTDFTASLTEEQANRFERPLLKLEEACTSGDPLDDM
jgi:hypothetical protein